MTSLNKSVKTSQYKTSYFTTNYKRLSVNTNYTNAERKSIKKVELLEIKVSNQDINLHQDDHDHNISE